MTNNTRRTRRVNNLAQAFVNADTAAALRDYADRAAVENVMIEQVAPRALYDFVATQGIQQPIRIAEHETLGTLVERMERERAIDRIYDDTLGPVEQTAPRQSLWRLWKREPGQPRVSVALFKTHYAAFQTICQLVDNTSAHYWVAEERTSLRDRIPETGPNSREAVEQRLRDEEWAWTGGLATVRAETIPPEQLRALFRPNMAGTVIDAEYAAVTVPPTPETTFVTNGYHEVVEGTLDTMPVYTGPFLNGATTANEYGREDFEANPAPVEERH